MSFPYKMHLDTTIHWCNLPAHFWRTNYCTLVKQTIWNASLLNRACQGSWATPPSPACSLCAAIISSIMHMFAIRNEGPPAENRKRGEQCSAQGRDRLRMCLCELMLTYMYVQSSSVHHSPPLVSFHMISCQLSELLHGTRRVHSWSSFLTGHCWCL